MCPAGYLSAFLSSPLGQVQLIANIHGAVVDELTEEHIGNVIVPLPDGSTVRKIDSTIKRGMSMKSQAVASAEASVKRLMGRFGQSKKREAVVSKNTNELKTGAPGRFGL